MDIFFTMCYDFSGRGMMAMLKKYYPFEYADDIYSINYKKLYSFGYRALIFDIDNTLVHHGDPSNEKVDSFFKKLHRLGFQTLLLSNNTKERVQSFNKNIQTLCIWDANKPNIHCFDKALQLLQEKKEHVLYIGDQIFVDICSANKASIPNILVKYVGYGIEKKIGIKRHLEKIILFFYLRSPKYAHRFGKNILRNEVQK